MPATKWFAALGAVACALPAALAAPQPQAAAAAATTTTAAAAAASNATAGSTAPAASASAESSSPDASSSGDVATDFVNALIFNVTELEVNQTTATAKRTLACSQSLTVDLGYAKYRGYLNSTTGLNYWRGIRYAQAPVGNLRWQPPVLPSLQVNPPVTAATSFGPICPQALPALPVAGFIPGNEDCLFLNVYAKPGAQNLPVMVYIHGGGYGLGDGTQEMAEIINANGNNFIAVTIQYRLGAFGFLSSAEVKSRGVVNAGLLDQALALAWVKTFICQFGGDPTSVTIAGESAGAGSVMYHDIALNGGLGNLLFDQSIAASPYLPYHYKYDAQRVTDRYYAFAQQAGCPSSGNVFDCLRSKDTNTLQQANTAVNQQQVYATWAFYPVTDNAYILNRPTAQLSTKNVNGDRLLVGQCANEGALFTPHDISVESDLVSWLQTYFPNLSSGQISQILAHSPNSSPTNAAGPRFETNGLSGPTAVNMSQDANGQQQRANNIIAEATFVCPSYWMASAYSSKQAWHWQYSVPFAWHTTDMAAYFGPATANQGADFALAFRRIWGNFITAGNPSISNQIANGASASNPSAPNGASNWPAWTDASPKQLNLNETGGVPYQTYSPSGATVTQFSNPGLLNAIAVVPADSWEGGRGARCSFYNSLGPSIPA